MHKTRFLAGAASAIALAGAAHAQLLTSPTQIAVGDEPITNTIADLDGDGHLDFIVANYFNADISVFYGDGAGAFSDEVFFVPGVPETLPRPTTQAVADFDGDGDLDIATAIGFRSFLGYLVNNGDRTFGPGVNIDIPQEASFLRAADVTGDGVIDLVMSHGLIDQLTVLPGLGDGNFGAPIVTEHATRGSAFALGDVDGDEILDMLQVNIFRDNEVTLMRGVGDGTFGQREFFPSGGLGPIAIRVHDINADGAPDAIICNYIDGRIAIALGDGAGEFGAPVLYQAGQSPDSIDIGDVNGDGYSDVLVGAYDEPAAQVFLGLGDGTLAAPETHLVDEFATSVVAGDFNEDGLDDLVVGSSFVDKVNVFLARSPADLNADGATDGADLGLLLGAWGACGQCSADLNADGVVDGADLGILLGAWG